TAPHPRSLHDALPIYLPDFTEQGEMKEILDGSKNDTEKDTAFARYMSDAMFLIPTPQVLQKIITGLDDLYEHDISDLDMQGDLRSEEHTSELQSRFDL